MQYDGGLSEEICGDVRKGKGVIGHSIDDIFLMRESCLGFSMSYRITIFVQVQIYFLGVLSI